MIIVFVLYALLNLAVLTDWEVLYPGQMEHNFGAQLAVGLMALLFTLGISIMLFIITNCKCLEKTKKPVQVYNEPDESKGEHGEKVGDDTTITQNNKDEGDKIVIDDLTKKD